MARRHDRRVGSFCETVAMLEDRKLVSPILSDNTVSDGLADLLKGRDPQISRPSNPLRSQLNILCCLSGPHASRLCASLDWR